ncbi:hypothetical protein RclHR1_05420014 [Rhizophagus clarus]|uniref:Uncharacterized protein n=1 Tax=Rhizophagus clarus TaxID=94130 RepID=A0A2Z6S4A6_9GLOM|nr:hypothetical protein RclHR1_05420014 [Rhizophagus clarus]GES78605.1 hypothetical protein GLOIN_2v1480545 [Rhizophagus clarus]
MKDFNQSFIQWCHYISCNKYIIFLEYSCEELRAFPPACKRAFDDIKQQQCICCSCYENLGGHIHHRPGKGKELHADDITKGLEYLGN